MEIDLGDVLFKRDGQNVRVVRERWRARREMMWSGLGMAITILISCVGFASEGDVNRTVSNSDVVSSRLSTSASPTTGLGARRGLQLEFFHESYVAKQTESLYGLRSLQNVSARYHGVLEADGRIGRLDVGGGSAVNVDNFSFVYAPEAFVGYRWVNTESVQLETSIGRRREAWSSLDSSWMLGLWAPLFRWDSLRPVEQGLTGAFVNLRIGAAKLTFFGSGLFLPEQGPGYTLRDGRISSPSPWFEEPTNSLILFSQATDIRYRIETPAIREIVRQSTFAARFEIGERERGAWMSGSIADKPRNQIALPFDAGLVLAPETGGDARVTVYPRVERHQIAALDVGYAARFAGVTLSALSERPQFVALDPALTGQRYEPLNLLSPSVRARLLPSRVWGPDVTVSYLWSEGGGTKEIGPFASERGAVFGSRLPWSEAISVSATSRLVRGRKAVDASVRWIEDFRQRGAWVGGELRFQPSAQWTLAIRADVLGSKAAKDDRKASGLINRFRGNDRIAAGISFVF